MLSCCTIQFLIVVLCIKCCVYIIKNSIFLHNDEPSEEKQFEETDIFGIWEDKRSSFGKSDISRSIVLITSLCILLIFLFM